MDYLNKINTSLSIPDTYMGHDGLFRQYEPNNKLGVDNDIDAVNSWLRNIDNERTRESYKREVERLFKWAIDIAKKPLSSLTHKDYLDYRDFVRNPPEDWISKRRVKVKKGEIKKPFVGPLSLQAMEYATTCIASLLSYWTNNGYITGSPIAGIKRNKIEQKPDVDILSKEDIKFCWEAISRKPENTERQKYYKARMRWILYLFLRLGLRIDEVSTHNMSAFVQRYDGETHVWVFYVSGKGRNIDANQVDKLPVTSDLLSELAKFRESMEWRPPLPVDPIFEQKRPLAPQFKGRKSLTPQHIRNITKEIFKDAAELIRENEPNHPGIGRLLKATPHTLRHTSITMAGKNMDIRVQQKFARHKKVETTMRYTHIEDKEILKGMDNIKLT